MTPATVRSAGRRSGVTLAETLVVIAIVSVLLVVVYRLFMSGLGRGEEMTEEHKLMVDVRGLLENVSRDVAAAHVILPADGSDEAVCRSNLLVARSSSDDSAATLQANKDNASYPFFADTKNPTTIKTPCRRIKYAYDPAKHEISRIEEKGTLKGQAKVPTAPSTDFVVTEYSFDVDGEPSSRVMARNVMAFQLAYLDYDEKAQAKLVTKPADIPRAACVGLYILAAQTAGLYAREPNKTPSRRQPVVEMSTKFWTARRLSEISYPEYFSSGDGDLGF